MKVLVTGGSGMLGTDVCTLFANEGHEVFPCGYADFDIADPGHTSSYISRVRPDLIIHAAAWTDVDGCERDPEKAFRINDAGAGNVAAACVSARARFIAISTDFVFDGSKREPYVESDTPNPLGVYGASKLAGENSIRDILPEHKIVRTSWLYGNHGKCFPAAMISAARAGKEPRVVDDQTGSPTYTVDLAEALLKVASLEESGTFHVSNSGACTWFELAVEAIKMSGLDGAKVHPILSLEWPSPTERPKYCVLGSSVLEGLGIHPLRDWREALADFVRKGG